MLAIVLGCCHALGQSTMHRSVPQSDTRDSSGNLRTDQISPAAAIVTGQVTLEDGSPPNELVEIYGGCNGARVFVAVADSKGHFTVNPALFGNAAAGAHCSLQAVLDGYRSQPKDITGINEKSGMKLGKVVLQPFSPAAKGLASTADTQASKGQRNEYRKALDEAAKQHWSKAIASLARITAECPAYASAWLTLGVLQQSNGDSAGAERSFTQAMRADANFALPFIRAAALEAAQGDWQHSLDHSQRAVDLDPAAFPNAWALAALANMALQHPEAAERSARAGLRLDADRQYPELEFALGTVLYGKDDITGAASHLASYIQESPQGPNAAAARNQLAQLRARMEPGTAVMQPASPRVAASAASMASIREHNAPLLARTPDHTCLETVSRAEVDTRGKLHDVNTRRVEVAVADGREIYAEADGKHFAGNSADLLGYAFSTTGLFGSMARAVIAGNDLDVKPAGEETLNGESVRRYDFRSLPGASDWSIEYGKLAGRAGEEGFFMVDDATLTLRRVEVHAVEIPVNLHLKSLSAIVDYEPETIAGRRVLLPETAQVNVHESSGIQRVSRIFFDHCRAFGAESTVSFDAAAAGAAAEGNGGRIRVPAGLDVTVALLSPVSAEAAAENDVITARVAEPVLLRGREIIARGAPVEGHLRLRRGENAVLLELDRVQTTAGWAPFYAQLATAPAGVQPTIPAIPGVAELHFDSKSARLEAGATMVWKTETLSAPLEAHAPQLSTTISMH
ncbi:MAG TPA: hypothetical protein VFA04_05180 [Bryobacteraceae bacterium]|nr:hypothetical protein [Bryobacteraceae bacterium]